ncbi:hypothetical protein GHT06_010920 [Daphnia sinensis]|uniref:Uncharacterized protein n=1 Tax=Daphnia sinensis TaxID=1820382 RepID=A0AAD5KZR3_9CRUS|nr:hypothetical protein GHT06_010920 [Daphnia sinensis]
MLVSGWLSSTSFHVIALGVGKNLIFFLRSLGHLNSKKVEAKSAWVVVDSTSRSPVNANSPCDKRISFQLRSNLREKKRHGAAGIIALTVQVRYKANELETTHRKLIPKVPVVPLTLPGGKHRPNTNGMRSNQSKKPLLGSLRNN